MICYLLLVILLFPPASAARHAPAEGLPSGAFRRQPLAGFNLLDRSRSAPGQITVEDFEITQSVQNMNHRVPIVAGKTTVVRVYLSYESDGCVAVKGVLSLMLPNGETKQFDSYQSVEVNPALNGNTSHKRKSEKASLNFRIPASEMALPVGTTKGKLRAQLSLIEYDPAGPRTCQNIASPTGPLDCDNCPSRFKEVDVIESPTLRVRLVGLNYTEGGSAPVYTPTNQDVALIKSWLARAYPVAQSKLLFVPEYITVDAVINLNSRFACNDANARLLELRGDEINNRLATLSTRYFGLVSDKGGFMEGCSSQLPAAAMFLPAIASGPAGSPAQYEDYEWDTDESYADFYTGHELAHTMGRKHPGFCSDNTQDDKEYEFQGGKLSNPDEEFIGFDVGDPDIKPPLQMKALPGTEWTDVMTYCAKRWLSSYTYNAVLSWLQTENKLDPTPTPTPLLAPLPDSVNAISTATVNPLMIIQGLADGKSKAAQDDSLDRGDFIQVVATINIGKLEGRITSARRRSVTTGANVSVKRAGHPAMIRLKDKDDKPLGQFFIRLHETTVEPERPDLDTADAENKHEVPPVDKPSSEVSAARDLAGLIDAIIPYILGTAKIELILFKKEGETESELLADTYIVSKRSPQIGKLRLTDLKLINSVTVPAPTAKDVSILVSWESKVPEGQQVTYKVEVSSGEDADWRPLAAGLTRTNYEIPPEQLPKGARTIRIRVTASDGFNSTTMTSKRISLP